MVKRILILLIALVLVFLAFWFLFYSRKENHFSGFVEAVEIDLAPEVSSLLVTLNTEEGSFVKKGDIIAKLNDDPIKEKVLALGQSVLSSVSLLDGQNKQVELQKALISQNEHDLKNAALVNEQAHRDLSRNEDLFKDGIIPEHVLETYRLSVNQSEENYLSLKYAGISLKSALERELNMLNMKRASLENSKFELASLEKEMGKYTIKSPVDGVVSRLYAREGEAISPAHPLLTIYKTDSLYVRVYVREDELGKIHLKDKATITPEAYKSNGFEGYVEAINRVGEFATDKDVLRGRQDVHMFWIKVKILKRDSGLIPGMMARISFNGRTN